MRNIDSRIRLSRFDYCSRAAPRSATHSRRKRTSIRGLGMSQKCQEKTSVPLRAYWQPVYSYIRELPAGRAEVLFLAAARCRRQASLLKINLICARSRRICAVLSCVPSISGRERSETSRRQFLHLAARAAAPAALPRIARAQSYPIDTCGWSCRFRQAARPISQTMTEQVTA
jgi:hypothetical protein